jgi:hypothetical protein
MKSIALQLLLASVWSAAASLAANAAEPQPAPYQLSRTLHVGGDGAWDHLTVDSEHKLLFVPRGTHTAILDAVTGSSIADIPGQKLSHAVALVPSVGRGFISDGGAGSIVVFDLKSYAVLGRIAVAPDVDALIYDSASHRILAVAGGKNALFSLAPDVDCATGTFDHTVDLGGKPDFLAADGRGTVYVNVKDKDVVVAVDTRTMKIIARWPTAPGGAPAAMAIDRAHHRLFLGCRNQKLIVMSADDGRILSALPIGAGADAAIFDGRILTSCRDGTISVAAETAPDKFEIVQTLRTRPAAGTMDLDPVTHALYLPTADFTGPADPKVPGAIKPDSFMILVVTPAPASDHARADR